MKVEKVHNQTLEGMNKPTTVRSRNVTTNTVNSEVLSYQKEKTSDNFISELKDWKTCDYWSLPKWLQTNQFILKGYRPPLLSYRKCFFSIFRIHTETVNIWSHLLGCLLFIAYFLHTAVSSLPLQDKFVKSTYSIGAILCFGLSSAFHTVECHSEPISVFFNQLDYCGITVKIFGTLVVWFYYIFICDDELKVLYIGVFVVLGACTAFVSLSKDFVLPSKRPLRTIVFVGFGLSGVIPVIHFILKDGWDTFCTIAAPFVLGGTVDLTGAVLYAVRIPERIFPGKCDIWFQSHQLLHVLVVLAAVISYSGIERAATFVQLRKSNSDFCFRKKYFFDTYSSYF